MPKHKSEDFKMSAVGMCFTGRINRLVNSFVGFIDGITVGISIKEQLQLKIEKIISKLCKQQLTYEDACKNISLLFEDENVKDDTNIIEYYNTEPDEINVNNEIIIK